MRRRFCQGLPGRQSRVLVPHRILHHAQKVARHGLFRVQTPCRLQGLFCGGQIAQGPQRQAKPGMMRRIARLQHACLPIAAHGSLGITLQQAQRTQLGMGGGVVRQQRDRLK